MRVNVLLDSPRNRNGVVDCVVRHDSPSAPRGGGLISAFLKPEVVTGKYSEIGCDLSLKDEIIKKARTMVVQEAGVVNERHTLSKCVAELGADARIFFVCHVLPSPDEMYRGEQVLRKRVDRSNSRLIVGRIIGDERATRRVVVPRDPVLHADVREEDTPIDSELVSYIRTEKRLLNVSKKLILFSSIISDDGGAVLSRDPPMIDARVECRINVTKV